MFFVTRTKFKKYLLKGAAIIAWAICSTALAEPIKVDISYIQLLQKHPPALSNIFPIPEDTGYSGAKLAINDSNTTGKFLQQHFDITHYVTKKPTELLTYIEGEYNLGRKIFILDVPLTHLIPINQWAKDKSVLLFNVGEPADEIRSTQCLAAIFHTIPSDAMKSDALAQWLLYRRMSNVLLVRGSQVEDIQLAKSFKRSAKRFGIKIVDEKEWDFNTDMRRTAQQEIPLFTQTVKDYDVVYVADRAKDFSEFIPFNTYLPRPVIGSSGLEALAWHAVIEQWGAAQLQGRFMALADRKMNETDFAGYLAVRSVAQAVHELHTNDNAKLLDYIKSDAFELAAYKGRKLSFRSWNKQLRMPLALVHPHALVSQSPQPGMLHPTTELDTLGFDIQESQCK
ncbi:ABC transporter substrate-binding protein [Colwellia sp. 20A7]|uniref:ABC transporter substrate-binding protein n=1 Tax=Colwellia sp. 20A7 TaxID=2689569 RepID=UPI00135C0C35|nr:ABC transporter substrate-binding protein [Colwellia sp. 20A7]